MPILNPPRRSMLAVLGLLLAAVAPSASRPALAAKPLATFDRVGAAARLDQILDAVKASNAPNLVGAPRWAELVEDHRDAILRCTTHDAFAAAVNTLIEASGVSHFRYYTDEDFSYWHARSAFGGGKDSRVEHVGLYPERIAGRWFVRGVLEGSPAAAADVHVRVGDEILTVNDQPYRPFGSFRGRAGLPTTVTLRRSPGLAYTVTLTPVRESLHEALQRAIRESIRVIDVDGRRVAYMHAWTLLGGREYRDLLALQDDVDGLLLDYRDGYGGTWMAAQTFLLGGGQTDSASPPRWDRPVVILIADGTRSAKEIVVDAVQRAHAAPLVGTPTPGHVISVGGFRRTGADGMVLVPGMRFALEGHPTRPDILVERDIRYCAGDDPQMRVARRVLTGLMSADAAAPTQEGR